MKAGFALGYSDRSDIIVDYFIVHYSCDIVGLTRYSMIST